MFVREKMKKQRESMVMNVSAEEMPAQLRKAAKSVSVTYFLTKLCYYQRSAKVAQIFFWKKSRPDKIPVYFQKCPDRVQILFWSRKGL